VVSGDRLSALILLFGVAFAALILGPALLPAPFAAYPLLRTGDVFDLLTPLVLIPLYWLLFRGGGVGAPGRAETTAFLVLAALWVEGQAMHLVANAIGHLSADFAGTPAATLVHVLDERLSHFLWHAAIVGLAWLLLRRAWRHGAPGVSRPFPAGSGGAGLPVAAGVLYGFTYFAAFVEAGTAPLGIPFAALVVVWVAVRNREQRARRPLVQFLFAAHAVALLAFLGWALYWRGLPEFSAVGIIE
jgi:hypothetical protein